MALKLIRRGPEIVRLDVKQGTSWQPAGRGQLDASSNDYPELATIQATGCTALRVYDFDAPGQPYWESTTGTSHTLTVIKTGRRLAVRAANTTDKTEVIMHVVPIPPPCLIAGLLRRLVGGCRGADTNQPGAGSVRQRVAGPQGRRGGGVAYQRFGCVRHGGAACRVHAGDADVCAGVGAVHDECVHTPRRRHGERDYHPAGLHRQSLRNRHLPHHLTPLGGGVGA